MSFLTKIPLGAPRGGGAIPPLELFLYTPLFWFYAISIWANAISMFVSLGGGTWSLCIKLTVPHPIPKLVSPTS